jgi:L-ascorbate metabolism protein UlaG (beta-lactamase superfamily)
MNGETQAGAETVLHWFGHASFRIRHKGTVIYIDPWKLPGEPQDAGLILVSHSHEDHYSSPDIAKASGYHTELLASGDVIRQEGHGQVLVPGLTAAIGSVRVTAVAAYNRGKPFHPKDRNWLGFLLELGARRIYYAGDTDWLEEMRTLPPLDIALLPVGGTYTMDAEEAARAVEYLRPKLAVPYHWGDLVGAREDAERFARLCGGKARILDAGETLTLD